jgi:hypothetical protein
MARLMSGHGATQEARSVSTWLWAARRAVARGEDRGGRRSHFQAGVGGHTVIEFHWSGRGNDEEQRVGRRGGDAEASGEGEKGWRWRRRRGELCKGTPNPNSMVESRVINYTTT